MMDSIEEILGNSVFYPACGDDGLPVKYFNEHFAEYGVNSYVYVDYAMNADRLRDIQNGFRYYHIVEQTDLAEGDLVAPGTDYRKYASVLTDEEIVRQKEVVYGMYRGLIRPFARHIEYERNDDADKVRGPERFTMLYIGAEGVAAYAALYSTRGIAPRAIAIIAPGTGFGGNYTDFYDPDSALIKLIRQGESQPEYIMFGDDRVRGFDEYLEDFDNLRQLDIMAISPNLHYSGNYQRHSANEIQGLPESCRAVMTRLDHLGVEYDDIVKQKETGIDRLEQYIYNRINTVSYNDLTDGELWQIFHLIQIWGGRMGKIYNAKNYIGKEGAIIDAYRKLVRTCLTIDSEKPRQEIYKTVYGALESFCKLDGMGVAYASKHTRFWLSKSMGRDYALPIYDSIMAKGVVGERYGASLSRIMCYWAAMDNKSSSENVSPFSLERQLFDYFKEHPNYVGDAKDGCPSFKTVESKVESSQAKSIRQSCALKHKKDGDITILGPGEVMSINSYELKLYVGQDKKGYLCKYKFMENNVDKHEVFCGSSVLSILNEAQKNKKTYDYKRCKNIEDARKLFEQVKAEILRLQQK